MASISYLEDEMASIERRGGRAELRRSLQNPHLESWGFAEQRLDDWTLQTEKDAEHLVDSRCGRPVRWVPGEGWVDDASESASERAIRHFGVRSTGSED